jgi:hypothetical protein
MRYVCLDNFNYAYETGQHPKIYSLTIGKVYDNVSVSKTRNIADKNITVINDDGKRFTLGVFRFKLLSDIREEKINSLGI